MGENLKLVGIVLAVLAFIYVGALSGFGYFGGETGPPVYGQVGSRWVDVGGSGEYIPPTPTQKREAQEMALATVGVAFLIVVWAAVVLFRGPRQPEADSEEADG